MTSSLAACWSTSGARLTASYNTSAVDCASYRACARYATPSFFLASAAPAVRQRLCAVLTGFLFVYASSRAPSAPHLRRALNDRGGDTEDRCVPRARRLRDLTAPRDQRRGVLRGERDLVGVGRNQWTA